MKKVCLALAGSALVLATPAAAQTVAGPFKSKGECNSALAWANYDARKGITNPLGIPPGARCEKAGDSWYIVI